LTVSGITQCTGALLCGRLRGYKVQAIRAALWELYNQDAEVTERLKAAEVVVIPRKVTPTLAVSPARLSDVDRNWLAERVKAALHQPRAAPTVNHDGVSAGPPALAGPDPSCGQPRRLRQQTLAPLDPLERAYRFAAGLTPPPRVTHPHLLSPRIRKFAQERDWDPEALWAQLHVRRTEFPDLEFRRVVVTNDPTQRPYLRAAGDREAESIGVVWATWSPEDPRMAALLAALHSPEPLNEMEFAGRYGNLSALADLPLDRTFYAKLCDMLRACCHLSNAQTWPDAGLAARLRDDASLRALQCLVTHEKLVRVAQVLEALPPPHPPSQLMGYLVPRLCGLPQQHRAPQQGCWIYPVEELVPAVRRVAAGILYAAEGEGRWQKVQKEFHFES